MAISTAQDIIISALQLIRGDNPGDTPSPDDLNACFDHLNMMLDSWSANSLMTTAQTEESFPLIGLQASYTIGPFVSCNFNTTKPFKIISAFVRDQFQNSSSEDNPIQIISREEYNAFAVKDNSSTPERLFYDPGPTQQTQQQGTISLYPKPDNNQPYTLFIISEKPFTEFVSLTDTITFPPSYRRAMVYNLALEISPLFPAMAIHPEITEIADESMRIIEGLNSASKHTVADLDLPTATKKGNILTGQ